MQAENWRVLSRIRLERSIEFYSDAVKLFESESYRSSASRLYFSVFHAMKAALALKAIDRRKHSGIISEFRKLFVKTGEIGAESSRIISSIQTMRHDSDYDDYYDIDEEELETMLPKAKNFIDEVQQYVGSRLSSDYEIDDESEDDDLDYDDGMNMSM
jgi:uncharacterized protein (UPF0332 family)